MKKITTIDQIAKLIDHTILSPAATRDDVLEVAKQGLEYDVAAVCMNPVWVEEVSEILKGSNVHTCSVVGFPLGSSLPETIAFEAEKAVKDGAHEIDMVLSVGHAKSNDWSFISQQISTTKRAIGKNCLKVIFEVCELTPDQIKMASEISINAGADYIKTSTGFGKSGATLESVKIMSDVSNGRVGIKAAGGIRSYEDLLNMYEAGATRIGTSSTIKIISEANSSLI